VLGEVAFTLMTKPRSQYYPGEASLAVAIIGIPCSVIAVVDAFLYWSTRHQMHANGPNSRPISGMTSGGSSR
jgi:hypothetical protein